MSLATFIDQSLATQDPNDLFACYLEALGEYGVDRVMYLPVRNTPYSDVMASRTVTQKIGLPIMLNRTMHQ